MQTSDFVRSELDVPRPSDRLLARARAQTLHLIGSALQMLLANAPKVLFDKFPQWSTPALASKAEQHALRLHAAIAALYEPCGSL